MNHTGAGSTDNERFTYPVDSACPVGSRSVSRSLSEKFKYDNIPLGANLSFSADPGATTPMPTNAAHADFWNT
jgi:hypothetical protein